MDVVRFQRRRSAGSSGEEIGIAVNDRDLAEVVRDVELPFAEAEGSPSIAGAYTALSPWQLDGSPLDHFRASPGSHLSCGPAEKTVLLSCNGCGEPGCWPLMAKIELGSDTVSWTEFEQPHRPDVWRYGGLRFTFDRRQYEAALGKLGD